MLFISSWKIAQEQETNPNIHELLLCSQAREKHMLQNG
ncbi:hypothetical protein CHCC20348_1241 [Bacillus paralicheniformis]|nr:hypothetical protein CHCC20348_1241 [Bacillus paralicheniformis]